jgi:hypothetical protein
MVANATALGYITVAGESTALRWRATTEEGGTAVAHRGATRLSVMVVLSVVAKGRGRTCCFWADNGGGAE